jgi:hypothetical protein
VPDLDALDRADPLRAVRERFSIGFRLASPRDAAPRGSQVCFAHDEEYAYGRFADRGHAVRHPRDVLRTHEWDRPAFTQRAAVTCA